MVINGEKVFILSEMVIGETPRGEELLEWVLTGTHRAKVVPLSSDEQFTPDLNRVNETVSLLMDGWVDVDARSRIDFRGQEWSVVGAPSRRRHSRTGQKRTTVVVERSS